MPANPTPAPPAPPASSPPPAPCAATPNPSPTSDSESGINETRPFAAASERTKRAGSATRGAASPRRLTSQTSGGSRRGDNAPLRVSGGLVGGRAPLPLLDHVL